MFVLYDWWCRQTYCDCGWTGGIGRGPGNFFGFASGWLNCVALRAESLIGGSVCVTLWRPPDLSGRNPAFTVSPRCGTKSVPVWSCLVSTVTSHYLPPNSQSDLFWRCSQFPCSGRPSISFLLISSKAVDTSILAGFLKNWAWPPNCVYFRRRPLVFSTLCVITSRGWLGVNIFSILFPLWPGTSRAAGLENIS